MYIQCWHYQTIATTNLEFCEYNFLNICRDGERGRELLKLR